MSVAEVASANSANQQPAATSTSGNFGMTTVGGADHVLGLLLMHPTDPGAYGVMQWSGVALTQVGATQGNATFGFISAWQLMNPTAAGSFNLNWTNSAVYAVWAVEFSSANAATPVVLATPVTGNSASPALTVPTVNGDGAMAAAIFPTATHAVASINQTGFFDNLSQGAFDTLGHWGLASGTTVSFTASLFGAENFLYVGLQVQQAGGGGGGGSVGIQGLATSEW